MSIREELTDQYDELLFADGYDSAIIGVACGHDLPRVVYDYDAMIEACMQEAGMTYEDSVEWIEYNTIGAYVGKNTPIYIHLSHSIVKDS
tara:strand:+ start:281 stop:550 length:270 start_codon:yes stop_codon:yes gene_type:complete